MKLLILGFSVTADPDGFAARVKRKLESRPQGDYNVITCGIGGVNASVLPEIYSQLLRRHNHFDLVVLEIATSILGQKINDWRREGLNVLYDLCTRIQQGGAKVAFVNLYRDEFDYDFHLYDMMIEAVAARYHIPLLDLGAGLAREQGKAHCRTLIRDAVHTNPEGAEFQALKVQDFILDQCRRPSPQAIVPSPEHMEQVLDVAQFNPELTVRPFSRAGQEAHYTELPAGQTCQLSIPANASVFGLSFCRHPRAGKLAIHYVEQNRKIELQTYDAFSYYTHFGFARLPPLSGLATLRISQLAELPDVRLNKGNPDQGERVGYICGVHVYESR